MSKPKPITLTLQGPRDSQTSGPSVGALLDQLRSVIGIFQDVEASLLEGERGVIDWRVTAMSKASPCSIEITPYANASKPSRSANGLVENVVEVVATGLQALAKGDDSMAANFPLSAVTRTGQLCGRLRQDLERTAIDFSAYKYKRKRKCLPVFVVDRTSRGKLANFVKSTKAEMSRRISELGSLEGDVVGIDFSNPDRSIVKVRSRMDGQIVRCYLQPNSSLGQLGSKTIARLRRGTRVEVYGLIKYGAQDQIKYIVVDEIELIDPVQKYPSAGRVFPPGYTGGLSATEYLAEVRKEFDREG